MDEREKMSGRKLLKLPPTLMARLTRTAARDSVDASEIIRRGLVVELDRMDAAASLETRRMEKLRLLAAANGAEIDDLIDRMLAGAQQPELSLAATGTEGSR